MSGERDASGGTSSARRRRERRLRSWAKHERLSGRNGAGYGYPPLVPGGHRVRRSTEPEACHQRWGDAAVSSRRGAAAGADPAAHCGADRRLGSSPNALHGRAADGGTVGGHALFLSISASLEQEIDVPKIVVHSRRCSHSPLCTAAGGTAGGSADARILFFFVTAEYGAER